MNNILKELYVCTNEIKILPSELCFEDSENFDEMVEQLVGQYLEG